MFVCDVYDEGIQRKKRHENGTEAVIGLFHERNVVRMRAAIRTFGGALRDSKKKKLRKETSEQKTTE